MKKCIIVLFIILTIILSFSHEISAYSTDDFSINIPSSYTNNGDNSFTNNSNGNSISIAIIPIDSPKDFKYDEETLNYLIKSLNNYLSTNFRDTLENALMREYSQYLTFSEIQSIANSLKYSITEKEITTFTSNYYKCFHLKCKFSIGNKTAYFHLYIVGSNNEIYILGIGGRNVDILSSELQTVVNSFTIKNFKELGNTPSLLLILFIIILPLLLIYLFSKRKNRSDDNVCLDDYKINHNLNESIEDESIIIKNNPYQKNKSIKLSNLFIGIVIIISFMFIMMLLGYIEANGVMAIILDIIITVAFYMGVPFFYLVLYKHKKYNKKQAFKISVVNSIVVAIIFVILKYLLKGEIVVPSYPPIFYGIMNYGLLLQNNDETENIIIKKCKCCGKQIDKDSKFCQYCGAKIDTKEEVTKVE